MKKNFAYGLFTLLIAVASCSFTNKTFENDDKDKLLIDIITYVLSKGHFEPKDVNDDFSANVFEDFIDMIDPTKRYFLDSDIKEFETQKFQIDDQIKNTDIAFFNLVYNRLMQRMDEAVVIYSEVLDTPFDYSKNETINIEYDKMVFAEDREGLKERWRKQLKHATLNTYDSKVSHLNEDAETAAAHGHAHSTIEKKVEHGQVVEIVNDSHFEDDVVLKTPTNPKEAEVFARESTRKTLDEYFDFVADLQRKDWFVQYINSIVDEFDPHTFYFAPEDKEKFDASMSGKFEGIGARLQKKPEGAKITDIISGGPVWRDSRMEVGDIIVKVGQNKEEPVDIVGMRLEDAIKMIKGPKGTKVDLTVRRIDGSTEVISLTRDVVELEESFAKSANIIKEKQKFGLINLPKFYVDFEDYSARNAASDVAKEVERLKEEGAEGLILDLRDNGGGSLKTVVEMAGLFIKDGPIVQVRSSGAGKDVYDDKDERIQWDGPLVILVNELSASASEILAAAMQDYKRAIVIGSKQTFGKGTVQNVIDLNNIVRSNENGDLGALKLTTQKFYRINGGSTQLEGVKSDIVVPDRYSYMEIGERGQSNPLAWDKITPADYEIWNGGLDYEQTVASSVKRMSKNDQIKLIEENAKWIKEQQDENVISLKYKTYKAEAEKHKEKSNYFKKMQDYDSKLTFESLKFEQELFTQDSVLREKRDRWHKTLARDVYVEEAVNVLQDLMMSDLKKDKIASTVKG